MRIRFTNFFAALTLFLCANVFAQPEAGISVNRAVVCTAVVDREPVGADSTFDDSVTSLSCFTELDGAAGKIVHAWYHADSLRAEILLTKGALGRWRTWSTKNMIPAWRGPWRVEVRNTRGETLAAVFFSYGHRDN